MTSGAKRVPLLFGLAGSLAVLLALAGCSPGSPAVNAAPNARPARGGEGAGGRRPAVIPVQIMTVHLGPLNTESSTAGSVMPVTQSAVASQVAGMVLRVAHLAGDWVRAGETVVQLDDSQGKLAVQNAQAALENAKINYDMGLDNANQSSPKLALQVQSAQSALASAEKNYEAQKALLEIGGAPASQVDAAKSQLEQAQANLQAAQTSLEQNRKADVWTLAQLKLYIDQAQTQLEMAKLNLQNTLITAPFAGQIAAVNVNPGMYVGLNTAVFVLVSSERQIDFNVPPADAPNLPVGTPVQFIYQGKTYPVHVSQAPSAPINGVVPLVASVSRDFSLAYGSVGTVTYNLALARGALLPIAALQTNEDQNYVFAIVGGKAEIRNVTILGESGSTAAVSGLAEGTQVILNAPPGLLAGSSVQPVNTGAEQAAASGGGGAAPSSQDPSAGARAALQAQGGRR